MPTRRPAEPERPPDLNSDPSRPAATASTIELSAPPSGELSRNIVNGLVVSVLSIALSLSYAALVFSGPLSVGLPLGVGYALLGSAVIALMVAWKSGFPFAIAGPDGNNSALLAAIVASLVVQFPAGAEPRAMTVNALYLLTISGVLTGLCLYGMGKAGMGRWIRFVPYPVTGGFIAGVGWLLVTGGMQIITDLPVQLSSLHTLFAAGIAPKVAAGAAYAAVLLLVLSRIRHFLALPILLAAGTLAALAAVPLCGTTMDEARAAGWFFARPAEIALWTPWSASDWGLFDPQLVMQHLDGLLSVVLVSTLSILMNATGVEMESRRDADLDRELRVQGGAHLAAAGLGGFPGYISLSRSLLNHRLGSVSRVPGLVVAAASLAFAVVGQPLIAYVPKPVLGGLILYIGCTLLWTWLVVARRHVAWPEYLTMLFITMVVTLWGFVTGVVVGVVAGCIIFAFNYSRVSILKHQLNGAVYASSRVRSAGQTELLRMHGAEIQILVLQGFIFFGTADRLYRLFVEQIVRSDKPVRFLILDFQFVDGIDSSALSSFRKICNLAALQGTHVYATGADAKLSRELSVARHEEFAVITAAATLDEGLEACESRLIEAHATHGESVATDLLAWLGRELGSPALAAQFLPYARRREVGAGERLCSEHDPADSMHFIESGTYAVEQTGVDGAHMRLRTLGHNTMTGEMGLYRGMRRSATVIALQPGVVYELTRSELERMRRDAPALAEALSSFLVKALSERLAFSNVLCMTLQA